MGAREKLSCTWGFSGVGLTSRKITDYLPDAHVSTCIYHMEHVHVYVGAHSYSNICTILANIVGSNCLSVGGIGLFGCKTPKLLEPVPGAKGPSAAVSADLPGLRFLAPPASQPGCPQTATRFAQTL